MKVVNEAEDELTRRGDKGTGVPKDAGNLWLENPRKPCPLQETRLEELKRHNLKPAREYLIGVTPGGVFRKPSRGSVEVPQGMVFLGRALAAQAGTRANTTKWHWEAIPHWFSGKVAIGSLEEVPVCSAKQR